MKELDIKTMVDDVNEIIKTLYETRLKEFDSEAINWGDLRVCSVEEVRELYPEKDEPYLRFLIEEAAPGSYRFCTAVADEFYKKYKTLIYVGTEW